MCGTALAAPQRVVSLNLCGDELLLALADPQQIAAVSWLSHDPAMTWDASLAQSYPAVKGDVEEILQLQPDLVLVGRYTTVLTQNMLRELGIPLVLLDLPRSLDDAYAQIDLVGDALGQSAGAQALVRRIKQAADGVRREMGSVVVYYPNGFTTGTGSLIDSVLTRAGLHNLAVVYGAAAFSPLPLEQLVLAAPDYLIVDESGQGLPSLADELLQHPALAAQFPQRVVVPTQAWSCGTGHLQQAFSILDRLG